MSGAPADPRKKSMKKRTSQLDFDLGDDEDFAPRPTMLNYDLKQSERNFVREYDYVIVFPLENHVQSPTCRFVLNRMVRRGLEIFPYESVQGDELLVLFRLPLEIMKVFADKIDFPMELDPKALKKRLTEGHPTKNIKPIYINANKEISVLNPYQHIFGKYEIEEDMQPLYDNRAFKRFNRLKLLDLFLKAPKRSGGCDLEVARMITQNKVKCMFPLHEWAISEQLLEITWKYSSAPWNLPFADIRRYFGEKIALFDVFMGHYSWWLIIPAVVGLLFQLIVLGTNNFSSPALPFFSLVLTIWAIFMLEYWKRAEAYTAMEWGMLDFEQKEPDRPEFEGELIKSPIDGSDLLFFPNGELRQRLAISQTIISSFIMVVVGVVTGIYALRFSLQSDIGSNASTIASILNAVQITVFNIIYQGVAVFLTDSENHRTDTQYEDSMIVKLFVFQFVNSYASFFFLAFIAQYLDKAPQDPDNYVGQCGATTCMIPLAINLAIIFGTRLTLTNFLEIFLPWLQYKHKLKVETEGIEGKILTPAEEDYLLMPYNNVMEGINNYAGVAVQFGFCQLFATALPSAPFFALISNYLKSKFLFWKRITFYQRPVPSGAQDIGTWQAIFQIIAVVSVVTNAAITCYTMDVLKDYSYFGRTWVFIGYQWALISMQFILTLTIHDVPHSVEIQAARNDFIRSKVIDLVEDEDEEAMDHANETMRAMKAAAAATKVQSLQNSPSEMESKMEEAQETEGFLCCSRVKHHLRPAKKFDSSNLPSVKPLPYPAPTEIESNWPEAVSFANYKQHTVMGAVPATTNTDNPIHKA